jgi:hypothetical protein
VFLESIDIVLPHEHQSATFTPFLAGISNPKDLRPDDWEGLDEDFILLYRNTDTDPGGLVMSRSTQQVGYVRDYFDDPRECLWADLHVVLDLYLRCINSGKFVLDEDCPSYIFDEFTHDELTSTLAMWDNLVAAIVARLPTQANNVRPRILVAGEEATLHVNCTLATSTRRGFHSSRGLGTEQELS